MNGRISVVSRADELEEAMTRNEDSATDQEDIQMSRKDIIRQIVDREAAKQPLDGALVRDDNGALYKAASDFFGTWETALKYAGARIPPVALEYSQVELLREIRRKQWCVSILAEKHVEKQNPSLHAAAIKYYESWGAAISAVGINPERLEPLVPKPGRDYIIERIDERRKRGQSLRRVDVSCEDYQLVRASKTIFGCWSKALGAAGMCQMDNGSTHEG